jgi:hypothetical protein
MNADDLKKRTTESLKELAALLEQGRSERLTSLLKTMARFHRYSWLCDPQHSHEYVWKRAIVVSKAVSWSLCPRRGGRRVCPAHRL